MNFKKHKSIVFYLLLTVVLAVTLISDYRHKTIQETDIRNTFGQFPMISATVEKFEFRNEKGEVISSEDLKGKNYLITLWKVNKDTIQYMDNLNRMLNEEKYKDLEIYPINIGNSPKQIEEFYQKYNYTLPYYMDHEKTTKWAFNMWADYPVVYLVDGTGTIIFRQKISMENTINNVNRKLSKYKQ